MTPLTWGRTSEVSTAVVRPGSSVVRMVAWGWTVRTPTWGGAEVVGPEALAWD